jgi:hypothetical protein
LEPEALPAVSISSNDETNTTEDTDFQYDSAHDYDVDVGMEDDAEAPHGVNLDCNVDVERHSNYETEEDEEEEDEEEVNEEEVNEEEEEDEYEDDGKEPRTFGH